MVPPLIVVALEFLFFVILVAKLPHYFTGHASTVFLCNQVLLFAIDKLCKKSLKEAT